MHSTTKRLSIQLGLLGILILLSVLRQATQLREIVLKVFILGNIILFLLGSVALEYIFRRRYRKIIQMLDFFDHHVGFEDTHSFTPISVIKYNIVHPKSPQKSKDKKTSTAQNYSFVSNQQHDDNWELCIVVNDSKKTFIHNLHPEDSYDLASVLIYLLQQDIAYDILAQHTTRLNSILYKD